MIQFLPFQLILFSWKIEVFDFEKPFFVYFRFHLSSISDGIVSNRDSCISKMESYDTAL